MQRTLLKSKIHRATVTDANLHYQGSIAIDPALLEAADILLNERVEIYNITNGERFATYAIPGTPGAGQIVLNGAAAHKVSVGDLVIIATYGIYSDAEAREHKPSLVFVDARNRIVAQSGERIEEAVLAELMSRLLLVLLLAAACSNAPVPKPRDEPAAAAVPFETLVQASNPGQSGKPRRDVIRDEATWQSIWRELREGSMLPEEPPAIDFNREMVILAALGPQGCVSRVTIRSVTRTADALVVDILEAPPAPNCVCITSERPIHLVRLERIDLPERFEAEQGVTSCG